MIKLSDLSQEQRDWWRNILQTKRSRYERICQALKYAGEDGQIIDSDGMGQHKKISCLSLVRLGISAVTMEDVNNILEVAK